MKNLIKNIVLTSLFMSFTSLSFAQDAVEEVVVTANKKEQTAQEIPMNISVITEQTIIERSIIFKRYNRTLLNQSVCFISSYSF